MRRITFLLAILMATIFITNNAYARPFQLPRFQPKDAVSSAMFNHIFKRIEKSQSYITNEEIEGSWSCTAYASVTNDSSAASNWEYDSKGVCLTDSTDVNFSDGRISTDINLFNVRTTDALDSAYSLLEGMLMFKYNLGMGGSDIGAIYTIKRLGEDRMKMIPGRGVQVEPFFICDKQNLEPLAPTKLKHTNSNGTISLEWTDNSDDETGFVVFRKDSVDGSFKKIGESISNSYSDTPASAGVYWYHTKARNNAGNSGFSNVIRVEVE